MWMRCDAGFGCFRNVGARGERSIAARVACVTILSRVPLDDVDRKAKRILNVEPMRAVADDAAAGVFERGPRFDGARHVERWDERTAVVARRDTVHPEREAARVELELIGAALANAESECPTVKSFRIGE